MCGLAGYIGKSPPNKKDLSLTSKILKHRGPDNSGTYEHSLKEQNVTLLHRRLSIIDLKTRADQPYFFKETVLIFNGEIYNYLEIREILKDLGHTFKTSSDTEVLIHALYEWEEKALEKLEGMWAFAWYNEVSGNLLLSRDRFGEKPLYFWNKNNGWYFSSEIKGLSTLANKSLTINENHLLRNLVNGYKSLYKTRETFFHDVKELPAGTFIKIDPNGIGSPKKYWQPNFQENNKFSYEDLVSIVKEKLIKAVKIRMRSDVPVAFCMSGGVDSNCLISIASKILDCDVHGFTIVNTDSRYEEQSIVNQSVKELDIKHTSVELSQFKFLDNLRSLINHHDAPVYTISYYIHWQLMRAISNNGYKVTISGTGADELFTGYYDHHNLYLYEISKNEKLFKKSLEAWDKYVKPIVRNPFLKDPKLYFNNSSFRDHNFMSSDFYESCLISKWREEFSEDKYVDNILRNRMLNEIFTETVPVILHEDDLNAMCFSMENRSPFLDRDLFDLASSIPTEYLIRDGRAKAILRDAMRGIVPNIVLDERKKVGFNAPIKDLLDFKNSNTISYILDDSEIFDLVSKKSIEKLIKQEYFNNSTSKFLFNFLNTKMFLENQKNRIL